MRVFFLASAATLLALLVGAPLSADAAAAAQQCATHAKMVQFLTKKYQEAPLGIGTVNDDRLVQLFVSAKGSWTVLVTKTDGVACIMAAGQNWEQVPDHLSQLDPSA